MHFRMTIHTTSTNQERRGSSAGQVVGGAGNAGVTCPGMATLTQQGRPLLQECRVVGAVGAMTVCAVVGNRRMLPEKGAALVSMTAVATVIQCGLFQYGWIKRIVGLVAVGARHVTETYWMR